MASPFAGQAITFTATVMPTVVGTPTGSVSFFDSATPIGSSTLTDGSASITTTLISGTHTITAVHGGDGNFTGSNSSTLAQLVFDFNFSLSTTTQDNQSLELGQVATVALNLLPVDGPFTLPITLSAIGLPPEATATFTSQVVTLGASPANVTMTI